jgi:hypothetical protein
LVQAFLSCGDQSKIAIGMTVWDQTNPSNTTIQGSGNDGVVAGGAASNTWDLRFSLGPTSVSGDALQFQIECANPPVGAAAPINGSPSNSKPTLKIVTHPVR